MNVPSVIVEPRVIALEAAVSTAASAISVTKYKGFPPPDCVISRMLMSLSAARVAAEPSAQLPGATTSNASMPEAPCCPYLSKVSSVQDNTAQAATPASISPKDE